MNNNTRKIVVLNNLNSPRIEQAIFILRDEVVTNESNAVIEAQKIVDMYVKSLEAPTIQCQKKKSRAGFFIGVTLYTFMTAILTAYIMAIR